jgi:hypothetical protein
MLCYYFSKKYSQPVDQAANNNGTLTVSPIIVAVDTNGNDVIIESALESQSKIFYSAFFCPPTCSSSNEISDKSFIKKG